MLNRAQRIVIVVGLGAALYVLGEWLTGLGSDLPTGWIAYAPLSNQFNVTGLQSWVRAIIWIALIGVWATASVRLLRSESPS
jgi:hypothetical protein